MEREEIIREDFPSARRGWDPDAVRAHLESLAERIPSGPPGLAEDAGARVSSILAAAEETAREIEQRARSEAEQLLESARTEAAELLERARSESERLLAAARGEAGESVEAAQRAVQSLIGQAEELQGKVGALGDSLTGEGAATSDAADAATSDAPDADAGEEPEGARESEPAPEPVAEAAATAETEPAPESTEEAAAPAEPDPAEAGAASTEDLIASLKAGGPSADPADNNAGGGAETAAADAATDLGAARLVAMNRALEGAGREQIAADLESEFGAVEGVDALLDDVLARAGR